MISAIILAAGKSARMGEPKMLLPWGNGSVISHVISVFAKAGVEDILVVTGAEHERVEEIIKAHQSKYPVRYVFNSEYSFGGMLSSIQQGLRDLAEKGARAAMIGLGDQPQVDERSVQMIRDSFESEGHSLIVPSFEKRRGHPWLVDIEYWGEILQLRAPQTARDFLDKYSEKIHYVEARSASVLADMDTRDDYLRALRG